MEEPENSVEESNMHPKEMSKADRANLEQDLERGHDLWPREVKKLFEHVLFLEQQQELLIHRANLAIIAGDTAWHKRIENAN
jgi:hypothetical protein